MTIILQLPDRHALSSLRYFKTKVTQVAACSVSVRLTVMCVGGGGNLAYRPAATVFCGVDGRIPVEVK